MIKRAKRPDLLRERWSAAIDRLLGDVSTGTGGPPNDWARSPKYPSSRHGMSTGHTWFAARFDNDGFDLSIDTKYDDDKRSRIVLCMAAVDFRRIALWYLWRWGWGEWFGLRRWLFYKRLHRKVSRYKDIRLSRGEEKR